MPVERVSKGFADLSMTFQINPINYDLISLKNETAIARSIRNIVLTNRGERLFNVNFGTDLRNSLFENMDDISISFLEDKISEAIRLYEPRVILNSVSVESDEISYELNATINYTIVGVNVLPQQLTFALQSAR
jgi:phage baseplate assembly protein W